jgi:hypothetical protein
MDDILVFAFTTALVVAIRSSATAPPTTQRSPPMSENHPSEARPSLA